jgi:hypothetical protein
MTKAQPATLLNAIHGNASKVVFAMLNLWKGSRHRPVAATIRTIPAAILCAGSLFMTACHRVAHESDAGLSIQQQLSPQPARVGPATLDIKLSDASARPVKGAKITVEADMTHPGMSPVFAEATEQSPGSYLATLNLNMGGDWVVLTHIRLPDGKKAERQMDVRGVRSN